MRQTVRGKLKRTSCNRILYKVFASMFIIVSVQASLIEVVKAHAGRHGNLRVTTYRKIGNDSRAERLPGVGIHLNRDCEKGPHYDTVTRNTGAGHPDNGTAYFEDCPVDRNTNKGTYNLSINSVPTGFHMADESSKTFEITWAGQVAASEISFILEKDTEASGPSQFNNTPKPIINTPGERPKGKIHVRWFVWRSGGQLESMKGGTVWTKASGNFKEYDGLHNCNPYISDAIAPGNSEVTFSNCWPSDNEANKQYEFYKIIEPAPFKLSSIRDGAGKEIGNKFDVSPGGTTEVQIWMKDPNAVPGSNTPATNNSGTGTGGSPASGSGGNRAPSSPPVLKPEVTPTAANPYGKGPPPPGVDPRVWYRLPPQQPPLVGASIGEALEKRAIELGRPILSKPPGKEEEDGGKVDDTKPEVVKSLIAEEVAAGTVKLTWSPSTDDSGEPPTYTIDRATNGGDWEPVESDWTDTELTDEFLDNEDLPVYEGEYTYRVLAVDDSGNESGYSTPAPIKTGKFKPTIPAAGDPANLDSPDETVAVDIADGATDEALDCRIASGDTSNAVLTTNVGEVQGEINTTVCREEDGDKIEEFDEEVEYDVDIENSLVSDDTDVYGFDGTDWEEIDTDEGDEEFEEEEETTLGKVKAKRVKGAKTTFKVKSKKPMILAVIDRNSGSPVVKIGITTAFVGLLGGVGFMTYATIVRRRQQQIALKPYEDVDIRPLNPRVDYTPTITAPHPVEHAIKKDEDDEFS